MIAGSIKSDKVKEANLEREFKEQLTEFIRDDSEIPRYASFSPADNLVLVKLFRYKPKKGISSKLILPDKQGKLVSSDEAIYERLYPIAKILTPADKYDPGDIWLVPSDEVMGISLNPEFARLAQEAQRKGSEPLVNPLDIPKFILTIDQLWARYRFIHPESFNPVHDGVTYLIDKVKLKMQWDYSAYLKT